MSYSRYLPLLGVVLLLAAYNVSAEGCLHLQAPSGDYGVSLQGRLVSGAPYGAVGLVSLQKDRFSLNLTTSVGGVVSDQQFQGTVKRNDCMLTLTGDDLRVGFAMMGQIADRGREILISEVMLSQPMVTEGVLRPVDMRRCSNQSLKGEYPFGAQGYQQGTVGLTSQWIPAGYVGVKRFDGKGCADSHETVKVGPEITDTAHNYQYQMYANCTVAFSQEGVREASGVLVDGGKTLFYLSTAAGHIRTGELTRARSSVVIEGCP